MLNDRLKEAEVDSALHPFFHALLAPHLEDRSLEHALELLETYKLSRGIPRTVWHGPYDRSGTCADLAPKLTLPQRRELALLAIKSLFTQKPIGDVRLDDIFFDAHRARVNFHRSRDESKDIPTEGFHLHLHHTAPEVWKRIAQQGDASFRDQSSDTFSLGMALAEFIARDATNEVSTAFMDCLPGCPLAQGPVPIQKMLAFWREVERHPAYTRGALTRMDILPEDQEWLLTLLQQDPNERSLDGAADVLYELVV